jgi:hypothetical protein
VFRKRLREKAQEIHATLVNSGKMDSNFKSSKGWEQSFLTRHHLTNRKRTTIAQKLPNDLITKLVSLVIYVRKLRIENKYQLSEIYAADETAVWLDNVGNYTLEVKGAKDVPLKSTGHEKMRVTVLLCARADGFKCKPYVLLDRKRPIPSLDKEFSSKLVLEYAGRIWMDDDLTKKFLNRVLGGFSFKKRLLVWDSFRTHFSTEIKKEMKILKIDKAIIPGGCTKFIQAPDVSWNKPFKDIIGELYNKWLETDRLRLTKGGNIAPPPLDIVCSWITIAWDQISKDVIIKSFKACGISNAIDGSEDHMIDCFKESSPCAKGMELLREKNAEISQLGLTAIERQLIDLSIDDNEHDTQDVEQECNAESDLSDGELDFE